MANAYVSAQTLIVESLSSRIDGILAEIESAIAHGIQDAEIDSAETLKKVNLRPSGALAGVILETHLQRVAVAHSVTVAKKDPTIGDLNEPLKKGGSTTFLCTGRFNCSRTFAICVLTRKERIQRPNRLTTC